MRSELCLVAGLAALVAGCAPSGGATTASAAPGRTDPMTLTATGEPRSCINRRNNVQSVPAGPDVLMFREGANRWFRNELRASCSMLRDNRVLVFRSTSSQLCELDLFDVVDPVSRVNFGSCTLGRFTPVEVPRGTSF